MKNIVNLIAILAISTLLASCSKDISNNTVEITQSFIDSIRQYDKLYPFSEGFAPVVKDGKWGYINNKGEAVIPCQFSSNAEPFVGGYAKVDNSYYINTKGEKVNLSEAEINARTSLDVDSISLVRFERNGKVGYMTKDSVVVVQPKYHILGSFHNGVAIAVLTNSAVDKNGDDYELVGRAQDWVDDGGEW